MASGSGSRGRGSAGARGSSSPSRGRGRSSRSRGRGSSSRSRSRSRARAAAEAPSAADDALLAPQLNPTFVAMRAADLIAHLNHNHRRSDDFVDVALVLADRERRHAENEGHVRWSSERINSLLDEMRAREYSALEAQDQISRATETEAALRAMIRQADETEKALRAKIHGADETEAALRGTIRELEERVANAEALARDRTFSGEVDESQAGDRLTAIDVGAAKLTGGEIRVPELGAGEIIATGLCSDAGGDVGDNIPSPIPLMRIDALPVPVTAAPALSNELMEERAVEGVVTDTDVAVARSHDKFSEAIAVKRKQKPASDLSLPLHDLRSGAGGSSQAQPTEAPLALLAPHRHLNPILDAMQAAELIFHLNCYRRTADFIGAAIVLGSRERRLAEAERIVRECSERINSMQAEMTAREYSALEAKAQIRQATETEAALRAKICRADEEEKALRDKIRRADETEKALRSKIRTLQLSTATLISGLRESGLSQLAAGNGRESLPQDFITASTDGVGFADATGVQTLIAKGDLVAAMLVRHGELMSDAAPHLVAAPLPGTVIDDDERATVQVATEVVPNSNKEAQGYRDISEDVLTEIRVTASGRGKVSREVAQGEDATASLRRSKGKQPVGATEKARKNKGTLQLGAVGLISSGISGCSLTQLAAAGPSRELVPQEDCIKAMFAPRLWSRPAPHLVDTPLVPLSHVAPHLFVTPPPGTLIDQDQRAAEHVATEVVGSDEEVLEDFLRRVRAERRRGRKVSEEEAQGEDVAASRHKSWQGEQAARASKKARKDKGACVHNQTFSALKEKEELLKKKEESLAKETAAAAASKQVPCRCWLKARNMSSKSAADEEDSDDGSQN